MAEARPSRLQAETRYMETPMLTVACEYAGQDQKSMCSRHFESFQLRWDHHSGQFLVDLFRVWNIGHAPLRLLIT